MASDNLVGRVLPGIIMFAGGMVALVISVVLVGVVEGFGSYIGSTIGKSANITVPNYVKSLNIGNAITIFGVALLILGAVIIIFMLIQIARETSPGGIFGR